MPTVAVNLALGMKANGLRVGVLDADIYGPSVPRMLGISGKPSMVDKTTLRPMENYGIKCMSIGFLVPEDTPMIWRGPMATQALDQLLRQTNWGELDYLIVDMPPGTGDIALTLSQRVSLRSCSSAWVTIGPRHTIGVSTSIRKPIEIACRPWPIIGSSDLPSFDSGRPVMPSIMGCDGP